MIPNTLTSFLPGSIKAPRTDYWPTALFSVTKRVLTRWMASFLLARETCQEGGTG